MRNWPAMGDRFLDEICRLHQLRTRIRALPPEKYEQFVTNLSDEEADQWAFTARDAQLPPQDLNWCWLFLAGRGSGKTRAMSAAIHMAIRAGLGRVHLIAPTTADLHDVNLEGPSGLLRTATGDAVPRYLAYKRRIEWPNGAVCVFFSAEEPESLRGPQCELCLAKGTVVTLANGAAKLIQDVREGDMVATPEGPHRVLWSGLTRYRSETISLTTCNSKLRLTPDHWVFMAGVGWREARKIKPRDKLIEFGTPTAGGIAKRRLVIFASVLRAMCASAGVSTSKFTKTILGLFPKAGTFITKTMIRSTITRQTWRFFRQLFIAVTIRSSKFTPSSAAKKLVTLLRELLPPNRIAYLFASDAASHSTGGNGVRKSFDFAAAAVGQLPVAESILNITARLSANVSDAAKCLSLRPIIRSFAQFNATTKRRKKNSIGRARRFLRNAYARFAALSSQPRLISSDIVRMSARCRPVLVECVCAEKPIDCYDIHVEGANCFFADGILVHNCVIDELARMRYQAQVFDNAMLGLRLGDRPRLMIATTPRPTPFMRKLVAMADVSITTGSTYDNSRHLAPDFLKKIRELYEGTRVGRQELQGAMILDPANALFKDDWLLHDDVPDELIEQVTVGVDPSGGDDEVGIVAAALLTDGRYAVLADRSTGGSPAQWGDAAVQCYDDYDADDIVVEINFGGDMATEVLKQAAQRAAQTGKRANDLVRIREVSASRGKAMRAEPVSLLYEKGRVLHRRGLDRLEAEMMAFSRAWDRNVDGSPNRLDAMVWSLTRLSKVITDIPIA